MQPEASPQGERHVDSFTARYYLANAQGKGVTRQDFEASMIEQSAPINKTTRFTLKRSWPRVSP